MLVNSLLFSHEDLLFHAAAQPADRSERLVRADWGGSVGSKSQAGGRICPEKCEYLTRRRRFARMPCLIQHPETWDPTSLIELTTPDMSMNV